jgi:hypothetical protein
VHFGQMAQQGEGSITPKRKLTLEDDGGDVLAVATADDYDDANACSDLQHLQLPNSGGWYAHFDHREGSIELGRSNMLAATAPPAAAVGGSSAEMLLVPTQWQQKPRWGSGHPCDAQIFDWQGGRGVGRGGDTRRVAGFMTTLDNLQQLAIRSTSA